MRDLTFRFKNFSCKHGTSSMRIGVDAVLLGAWADVSASSSILDVGCGCGVIALMCAQRNPKSSILAIDIDSESVAEANCNFRNSPWSNGIKAILKDFNNLSLKNIDLIISNPPFFDSGVSAPDSPRLKARHQSELSPVVILQRGREMLAGTGRISMIIPSEQLEELESNARDLGLLLLRTQFVRGHDKAPIKRALVEFGKYAAKFETARLPVLTLESAPGVPTPQYVELCKDFYLKF